MSYTRPQIYNLALSALQLSKEVSDVTTDQSNEVRVLNTNWNVAFESTLQDMDLDSTASIVTLELIANLSTDDSYPWGYVYKYPSECIYFRRIVSGVKLDDYATHIPKSTGMYGDQKGIFTDESSAEAEIISKNVSLTTLSGMGALAIAYKLAYLSAPLITGKGSKNLRSEIMGLYVDAKSEAIETDKNENHYYEDSYKRSEWVRERLT